jgi:diguanylate cyclase (GGDEF)-like protein
VAHEIAVGIEHKRTEAALAHQALHDSLTGLPNRSLLLDRLDQAMARARRRETRPAVLLLDLDHFKVVNESQGHAAGDRLLVAVAERLRSSVRPSDTVARFGGDEFVVVCEDMVSEWEATLVGQRLSATLEDPFLVDGHEHFMTASIGVVLADPDDAPEAVLRDADSAMYEAKHRGRARTELFDERLRARAAARMETESALRRALDRGEFILVYQPIVLLSEGRMVGAEALLRWQHPERGTITPDQFIPVAEETGLIVPIGAWVLEEACRQSRRWREAAPGRPPLAVSVNLSARQLVSPGFLDVVARALSDNAVDPSTFHLEITESVLMGDADFYVETLTALKALGVRLAIDDFGTGYSSLSYLRRFPIDKIKVDRSFVSDLDGGGGEWSIVAAVIAMAQALGRVALAEGVETPEQLSGLRALGCDFAQGYHFSRPLPPEDLDRLLASDPRW